MRGLVVSMVTKHELDKSKRLSEQILPEDVKEWINAYRKGEQVVVKIGCSTGMGKTYFVNNTIANLLESEDLNMLYLSPRSQLVAQQIIDTNDLDCVNRYAIATTQYIQYMLVESDDYIRVSEDVRLVRKCDLPLYDIIVVDEAHLLINDSLFNQESLLVLNWLKEQNKIVIFLSGTGYNLFSQELSPNEISYTSDDDYSMVKEVVIANSDEQLIEKANEIYSKLGENEKILIITEKLLTSKGEDTQLSKWSRTLPSHKVSFVYSKGSGNKFKMFKDQQGVIREGTFSTPVLIGTKTIAEGINITDPNCKYLIQNFADEDTHLQANGRLRNREGITLVVRAYNNMELNGKIRALNEKYGVAIGAYGNEEKIEVVQMRYKNKIHGLPNGFYRDSTGEIKINKAEMIAVLDTINQYRYAIAHKEGHAGVLKELYTNLKVSKGKIIDLDDVKQELTNNELIEYFNKSIEMGERFVTPEQKDILVRFCNCRDKQGRLVKTPKAINRILLECGIGYEVKIKETSKMVGGKKTKIKYWAVTKL